MATKQQKMTVVLFSKKLTAAFHAGNEWEEGLLGLSFIIFVDHSLIPYSAPVRKGNITTHWFDGENLPERYCLFIDDQKCVETLRKKQQPI